MTFWKFPRQAGKGVVYVNMDQVAAFEADPAVKGGTVLTLANGRELAVAVDVEEIAERVRKRQSE